MSHMAALDIERQQAFYDADAEPVTRELYDAAYDRIHADPTLAADEDLLLHEWSDYAEHLQWVATASTGELTDWVWRMKRQAGRTA